MSYNHHFLICILFDLHDITFSVFFFLVSFEGNIFPYPIFPLLTLVMSRLGLLDLLKFNENFLFFQ